MPGFCIYQGSEYTRILTIPVLWIFEGCEIPQFQIYKGSEYTWVALATECTWISLYTSRICLIMCDYARMLNTNLILSRVVSLKSRFVIFESICIDSIKCSIADFWQIHEYAWDREDGGVLDLALVVDMPGVLIRTAEITTFWMISISML